MSLVAFLATRIKLPPWLIEALLAALLVLGIWLSGVFHERARVEIRTVKQKVQVEKRVIETDHSLDAEIADLRAYRVTHPEQPVRLCLSMRIQGPAQGQPSTPAADVQPVPGSGDRLRTEPGPDIAGLLGLLASRADEVSAGLRRRQELEP